MKQKKYVFLLLFYVVFFSVNVSSQNVVELGEQFIKSNISDVISRLYDEDFHLYSGDELRAMGHDPSTTIIGDKGDNPTNSLMLTAKTYANCVSLNECYVKEVSFVTSSLYGNNVVSDLLNKGYKQTNSKSYLVNNQWTWTDKTYKKTSKTYTVIAVVTLSSKGECINVAFTRKRNS